MKTPVILCADDYALTPGISRGIRDLAGAGRLSATSAMTLSPYWDREGPLLRAIVSERFAAGLHFTLTEYKPLTQMTNLAPDGRLPKIDDLVKRSWLRRLDAREIAGELNAQLDRFEAVMGAPPAYLDGHHHSHQLPVVRDVVIDTVRRRLGPDAYVRMCDEPLGALRARGVSAVRAAIISLLGRVFAARARTAGLSGNRGFRGVRAFDARENPAELFSAYLDNPQPGMMIMCHPGYDEPVPDIEDEIHARRPEELAYLLSAAFADALVRNGIELAAPRAGGIQGRV